MLRFRPGANELNSKGICQNHSNRCPALPESCSILKELPQRGRKFDRTGRNCFDVLRTPKYNKLLEQVKDNLQRPDNPSGTRSDASYQPIGKRCQGPSQPPLKGGTYFNASSRVPSRDL